jgi:transcriptional regulator with XRE-family HTH domain
MAVASSLSRREELRAFLRSRRARLSPADVGLPDDHGRRRTPGLRREELAALAGVGVSWYTWLEQGRDIHPSPEVLDALARALRLDAAERKTLFALARVELPLPAAAEGASADHAADGQSLLVALVEALHPTPAYLLGPMTRILAWNRAARGVLGSPDHLLAERRSLLWFLLVEPDESLQSPGRQATARNMVARFRSE